MKFKMKPLVLAMAMMGAYPAHALMDNGTSANGSSLVLVKYDSASGVSLSSTFDLGFNYKDFTRGNTSFTAPTGSALDKNQQWDLSAGNYADAWTSFAGARSTAANVRWGVFAVDSTSDGNNLTQGIIQSFNTDLSSTPPNMTNSQVDGQTGNVSAYIIGGNFAGDKVVSNHNNVPNGSDVSRAAGDGNMANLIGNGTINGLGGPAVASYDEDLAVIERLGGGSSGVRSSVSFYERNGVRSEFKLTSAGVLTFTQNGISENNINVNPAPAPVSPSPVSPSPVSPTPVSPTPVSPTPVSPTPVSPTPTPQPEAELRRFIGSNIQALRGIYNMQTAVVNAGLNYDCTTFDAKGLCLSAGGRMTQASSPSTNSQAALIIASYQATPNVRIGGYLDQNVANKETRDIEFDNNNPMAGVFAVWNQNQDGTGFETRLSGGYSTDDMTITRSNTLNTRAGSGEAALRSQAFQAVVSHGFQVENSRWIASPYFGVRYTKIERTGYSEKTTANGVAALRYDALSHETSTLMAGVRFNGKVGEKVSLLASAGVEGDISDRTSDYAFKNTNGSVALAGDQLAFSHNLRRTRPVALVGMNYAIDNRQSIGAHVNYRQEAFNSSNSVTGFVNYQIGF